MNMIRGLWSWLASVRSTPPTGIGQRIQEAEQAAARDRLIAQARRRTAIEHGYPRPGRGIRRASRESRARGLPMNDATLAAAEGVRVRLEPHQWQSSPGVLGQHALTIDLVRVHESWELGMVWVYAHLLGCHWESSDCRAPWCQELLLDADVLLDAVSR
ncbi:hypothetical protein AB0K20_25855 [Micromonospora matsumotoense]|uniref:hypothetical protein n=1 Tax=Micromonospora matsumotoense TaxID=121616 RepID=UPI00343D7F3F